MQDQRQTIMSSKFHWRSVLNPNMISVEHNYLKHEKS